MKRILAGLIGCGVFFLACSCDKVNDISPQSREAVFDAARHQILSTDCLRQGGWIFVTGRAVVQSSSAASQNTARLAARTDAESKLGLILEEQMDLSDSGRAFGRKFSRMLFRNWLLLRKREWTVQDLKPVYEEMKAQRCIIVCACPQEKLLFREKYDLSYDGICREFRQYPARRNELLFYELIPAGEIPAQAEILETNLGRQYGSGFAGLFIRGIAPGGTDDIPVTAPPATASLRTLTAAIDKRPSDRALCLTLAEKFDQLEMSRCAAVMRTRAQGK